MSNDAQSTDTSSKKSYLQRNAETFLISVKTKEAAFLKGRRELVEGSPAIIVKPVAISSAFTGRLLTGTNQLNAQTVAQQNGIIDAKVVTYDQAIAAGTYITKNSSSFTASVPKMQNGAEIYRFFFINSVKDQDKLLPPLFANERKKNLIALRNQILYEKDDKEYEKLMESIINEHKIIMNGSIFHPTVWEVETQEIGENEETGEKLYGPVLDEKGNKKFKLKQETIQNTLEYISKMPEAEQKIFREKNPDIKKLISSYKPSDWIKECKSKFEKKQNYYKSGPEVTIDARNCHNFSEYLGKWMAATTLSKTNNNVKFITDENSIASVQKELIQTCENAFIKNNYTKAFSIGKEASENCKKELSQFREQEYAKYNLVSEKSKFPEVTKQPDIDVERSF